jgi:hypothetical protein
MKIGFLHDKNGYWSMTRLICLWCAVLGSYVVIFTTTTKTISTDTVILATTLFSLATSGMIGKSIAENKESKEGIK